MQPEKGRFVELVELQTGCGQIQDDPADDEDDIRRDIRWAAEKHAHLLDEGLGAGYFFFVTRVILGDGAEVLVDRLWQPGS